VTVEEILGAIAVLETVSLEQGRRITPGAAVGAAFAAAIAALGVGASDRPTGQRVEAQAGAGVPA
jgi:hypothetical protein